MKQHMQRWAHREKSYTAFMTGPVLQLWRQRQEKSFVGKDNLTLRYVTLTSPEHTRAILLSPGRAESYVKYAEVAYDLFHCGYDIFIIDHRGQGRSDRILEDRHLGHVENFSDYVDDLETLYELELANAQYQHIFGLAHSMGGAIMTLLLHRRPEIFTATALLAPMFGIVLPMPEWMAERILNWTESRRQLRDNFAMGVGRWHATPFAVNTLTHCRSRYQRNLAYYADLPEIQVGGPTAHWVREAINVGKEIDMLAAEMTCPMLLLQASDDQVVDNQAQQRFCAHRLAAGHPCEGEQPYQLQGARHEILFEKDKVRSLALNKIINFYSKFLQKD